jgi:hypothetical protein
MTVVNRLNTNWGKYGLAPIDNTKPASVGAEEEASNA